MAAIQFLASTPPPDWLRTRVYAGDLLVVRSVAAMHGLVSHFRGVLCDTFETQDPMHSQFALGRDEWDRRAHELHARCKRDDSAWQLAAALFQEFGFDPARTAADLLNLRCQPHKDDAAPDPRHTLDAHRDTWASNVYQQINWWAPIYPVTPDRTIALFPSYWDRPIANDSAEWDLAAIRAEIQAACSEGREPEFRNVPEPTEPLHPHDWLPIVIEPGDVLVFSGAHLHASVPNASGAARFSVELRTADAHDAIQDIGAANIDGAAPETAWHWFRYLEDGSRMEPPDVMVEPASTV